MRKLRITKQGSDIVLHQSFNGIDWDDPPIIELISMLRILRKIDYHNNKEAIEKYGRFFFNDEWLKALSNERPLEKVAATTMMGPQRVVFGRLVDEAYKQISKRIENDDIREGEEIFIDYKELYEKAKRIRMGKE